MLISYILLVLMVMISVGYFVLLERKVLSSVHLREGPKKSGIMGLFQPFCDGGKLFSKGFNVPVKSDYYIFMVSPILSLMLCFLMWILSMISFDNIDLLLGFLLFLCLSSLNAYVIILAGWSSNSIYSMMGSYRGVAQSISYEVVSALFMMGGMSLVSSYNLKNFLFEKKVSMMCFLLMIFWLVVMFVETNRSPFDFVEGESELVSGFNVEYSSIGFSMLFLSEYGMIMFMGFLGEVVFWGSKMGIMMSIIIIGFIWVRGVLPRYRYDKLMGSVWKFYLYNSLCYLMFLLGLMNLSFYYMK